MTPRRYRSAVRAEAHERTRSSIVGAATSLYARQGVVATSWEDLASEAGVSVATVYRHFPSLDDLIPACAQASFDVAHVPAPDEAEARFATVRTVEARLRLLVYDTCHCFVSAEAWLTAAYRDADVVPAMTSVVDRQRAALEVLIRGAIGKRTGGATSVGILVALIDFPFWKALSDAGVAHRRIPAIVLDLVLSSSERGR